MAATLDFELVSPEKLLVSEAVEMVVIPGAEGDIGVLPGHAPLITALRLGVICIFANKVVVRRIFVAGGFAEVTAQRCTVLAEEAVPFEMLSVDAATRDVSLRRDEKNAAIDGVERRLAKQRLVVARAKLDAIAHPPYAG